MGGGCSISATEKGMFLFSGPVIEPGEGNFFPFMKWLSWRKKKTTDNNLIACTAFIAAWSRQD